MVHPRRALWAASLAMLIVGTGCEDRACSSEWLCRFEIEGYDAFYDPLPPESVASARCVLQTLRDRTEGVVQYGWTENAGQSQETNRLVVHGSVAVLTWYMADDLDTSEPSTSAVKLFGPSRYQACIDLPDNCLNECFQMPLWDADTTCPAGCDCAYDASGEF